jgi:pimeloyl-ACP methyl ester carboxylesterase
MFSFFKSYKKLAVAIVVFAYILFCQSCMKMRMNRDKTNQFFSKSAVQFQDNIFVGDNFKIHYLQTGIDNNPTLLFIHGSPGSWDAYKNYLSDSLLLKKYRLIAIDRPGFGFSNFGNAQNLEVQALRISKFVQAVANKKPVVLIGHSMGGPIIAKLAIDNPSWYNHLVILAGSIDPNAETPENWRPILKSFPVRYLIPGALRPSNDELWWLKQDLIAMKSDLKKIKSSVTIIHGTKDQLVPYANVPFIQSEFIAAKTIKVISIDDANHFIPWTHFETIRAELLQLKL